MMVKLKLMGLDLSVVKLDQLIELNKYANRSAFISLTRTESEISLVVESRFVKKNWQTNDGWKALAVEGPLDFSLVGVLNTLLTPLANAGVSVFTISTFDTDYILVKEERLTLALDVLGRTEWLELIT